MFRLSPHVASGLLAAATAVFATLFVQAPTYADDVYLCTGSNGVLEYRNSSNMKGCKESTLSDMVTVPGMCSLHSADAAPVPAQNNASGGFSRVDSVTQKTYDNERHQVLEAELTDEERKFQMLRAEYNSGQPECQGNERNYQKHLDRIVQLKDDIGRSQVDVDPICRELGSLKEQVSYVSTDPWSSTPR